MTVKTELLDVTDKQDADLFITFIQKFQSRAQVSDLEEAVGSLSRSELCDVWERVHNICTSVLLGLEEEADVENNEPNTKQMVDVLQGIVTLTHASMASEAPALPDTLFDTAVIMHGVLVSLPESSEKLKNAMCRVFENWWLRDLEGKEELGANTLTFLLERTLQTKSALADVKRVWGMREAVKLFDINSPSGEHVRRLLLHCFIHVSYLKAEEGRRFLSYLFSLGPDTIELFHKTIKNQLPVAPRTLLESYGEVYFRAWRVASGESLEKLESGCIQDLMHHAVHASRQSSRSLAHVLRKVLGYFHMQKKQRGVDEMLLRLYEPILWRSLKVANGAVRANAASLLVDTFPLQNPESNVEEADSVLQKQFDLLQDMLLDPCVEVRVVTIRGVCRIISVYWEVIPQEVIKALITTLYKDLIYDVSSAEVRVTVIKGQLDLLDNHLCHPLLESLLPTLRDFIHDVSEKVRLSMLELLTRVKTVRRIRFWSIVPMEHLLTRLELDTAPVARRIMRLIFSSFVPADKGSDIQISRCVALLRSNPGAARRFFQFAHKHMTIQESVKYIVLLCRCVLSCVLTDKKKTDSEAASATESPTEGEDSDAAADDEKENDCGEGELSVKDVPIMVGMLEAMAILWRSISPSLDKPENAELKTGLRRKFAIAMPEFLNAFQTPSAYSALVLLSGFMPPQLVPHLSRSCLSRLKDMTDENDTKEYSILLEAMCNWGKMGDVIELLSDWLEDGLKIPESKQSSTVKVKKKEKKTVAFTDPRVPQPSMALRYLSCLFSHPVCQDLLLNNCRNKLRELSALLKSVMKCLEKRFVSVDALGPRTTDDFLTQAFIMYQKLEILLYQANDKENTAVMAMEQLYAWADVELLSALRQKSDDEESPSSKTPRKRKIDSQNETLVSLALELVKSLLITGNNMLLVGIGDQEFASQITDFVSLCLRTDRSAELLPLAAEALFQLSEHWRVCENVTDDGVGSHSSIIPSLFSQFLQSLAASINKDNSPPATPDRERAHTLLASMKGTLTEMLQAVYRCQHLDNRVVSEVIASVMAAVISDLTFHSKLGTLDHDELCETLAELPPISAFLITTISKKNYMATSFLTEFDQCIQSGSLSGLHSLSGAVYLLANLCHCKPSLSGEKNCLTSIQSVVDRVRAEMTDVGEDSPDRLVLDGLTSSLRRTQDQLISV